MRVRPIFAWYDFWVGFFWDQKKKRLYFFPIPMLGVYFQFGIPREPYPLDRVPIPKGWRAEAFRRVMFGDYFLTEWGEVGYQDGGVSFEGRSSKRIIVVPTGGESGGFYA